MQRVTRNFLAALLCSALAGSAFAQLPSSSSSSSSADGKTVVQESTSANPRLRSEAGAAVSLDSNEALFVMATALNACGYDADLANSHPVRAEVRADVAAAVAASPTTQASQAALCAYVHDHELSDKGRELAQYVSLALYVSPPPKLTPIAEQTEMPPDALQVVNILPLLRTFSTEAGLHGIWQKHHAEYEAITDKVHDPVSQLVIGTNFYLKMPLSSYDGRRLLILVEPMLAPNAPNARIYSTDYIVVTSPSAYGNIRMDQIRHLYLHYEIEPLVYARATSMTRLTPLLKPVEDAPLDYVYKTDVVALLTECLIKAIEARTMETGVAMPKKTASKARLDLARYDEELSSAERQAETVRRKQVDLDMRQGWTMTEYFYTDLLPFERTAEGLNEIMGQMVYGMDVERERKRDEHIAFLPVGSGEFVRRVPRAPTGLMLAEKKMFEQDLDGADEIADKALTDPKEDHAEAMYVKARVELMRGDPEKSKTDFEDVLHTSKTPRTQAWAHVYLGRLYDAKEPTERAAALSQYRAALATPGLQPDARAAAETGLRTPFAVPKLKHEEEEPLDPSGKKEKESYKPDDPK